MRYLLRYLLRREVGYVLVLLTGALIYQFCGPIHSAHASGPPSDPIVSCSASSPAASALDGLTFVDLGGGRWQAVFPAPTGCLPVAVYDCTAGATWAAVGATDETSCVHLVLVGAFTAATAGDACNPDTDSGCIYQVQWGDGSSGGWSYGPSTVNRCGGADLSAGNSAASACELAYVAYLLPSEYGVADPCAAADLLTCVDYGAMWDQALGELLQLLPGVLLAGTGALAALWVVRVGLRVFRGFAR
jgi:hypothetical protein